MRDYKFRGKTNKEDWVYGWLDFCDGLDAWINEYEKSRTWVKADTVGQYTGLPDYDGTTIYEGDILCEPHHGEAVTVEWKCGGFIAKFENGDEVALANIARYCRVIGNIHEGD